MNRGMDKEDVVHIYNGILLSHKKETKKGIKKFGRKWQMLNITKKTKHMDNRRSEEASHTRERNKY